MRRALLVVWMLGAGCGQLGGTVCPLQTKSTFRVDFDPPFSDPGSYEVDLNLGYDTMTKVKVMVVPLKTPEKK